MHQLLVRGLPPLSQNGSNVYESSSASCVLLDGDWALASPREAVAAALMKQHSSTASAKSTLSSALPHRPLSLAVALALADKVRAVRRHSRGFEGEREREREEH